MIKKLFGGKSNEFFLELDETGNNNSTETKAEEKQPTPAAVAQAEEKQPEIVEAKSAKKSQKTSIKSNNNKSTPTTPSVTSNGASSWDPPFWVKAMYNNNGSSNGKVEGGEKTFATDYLLPTSSSSRRRPGPSLNKFKDMARQAKIRRR